MIDRVTFTISLPSTAATALRELAAADYHGNISAAIRAALTTSPVTKSYFSLPDTATGGGVGAR